MASSEHYDLVAIGSGPAGQEAVFQAAREGYRVALVESGQLLGGACVHRGTIPSKVLHENALRLARTRREVASFGGQMPTITPMTVLTRRLRQTVQQHHDRIVGQLSANGIDLIHGRGRLAGPGQVEIEAIDGSRRCLSAGIIILATGSSPRTPDHLEIDHEQVLDSDSILSLRDVPSSLLVVGSGVIACEYASIFACLGSRVTVIDRFERPLGFLDRELTNRFEDALEAMGGRFVGETQVESLEIGPLCEVIATLDNGVREVGEKMMVAAGRVPNVSELGLESVGLDLGEDGAPSVDANGETQVPGIYAVGDIVGAPALASAAMEQGRRACRHALGMCPGEPPTRIPAGIFTIPEIASVGLCESRVREKFGDVRVGLASYEETSRHAIDRAGDGLVKLIADGEGRLQGVQIVGDSATELVHLGLMALINGASVETFVTTIFNYPTQAEAYRLAALSLLSKGNPKYADGDSPVRQAVRPRSEPPARLPRDRIQLPQADA